MNNTTLSNYEQGFAILEKERSYIIAYFCILFASAKMQQIGRRRFLQELEASNVKNKERYYNIDSFIQASNFLIWAFMTFAIIEQVAYSFNYDNNLDKEQNLECVINDKWIILIELSIANVFKCLAWEAMHDFMIKPHHVTPHPILKFSPPSRKGKCLIDCQPAEIFNSQNCLKV